MAITQVNVSTPVNEIVFTDTAMGAGTDAVKASSAVLFSVTVNNTANVAAAYVKLYNLAAGSVTVGTSVPDEVVYVPGSSIVTRNYFQAGAYGQTFGTALTAACLTTGGTGGTTPPASSVSVSVTYV